MKFKNVKSLNLSYNKITTISNIDHMRYIQVLELQYNKIQKIQGLNSLKNLMQLNLSGNLITEIDGLQQNTCLRELDLSNNLISSVQNCNAVFFMDSLETLHLRNNKICDNPKNTVAFCEALKKIKVFSFLGNPVCPDMLSYKKTLIAVMRNLTNLDGEAIKHLEQADSDKWMRGGLYEYARIKHENKKNKQPEKTKEYFMDFH